MNKKVNIAYACNQQWEKMNDVNDATKYCKHCTKNVVDYTGSKITMPKSGGCARFSIAQVGFIKRQLNFKNAGAVSLSLLSFLGLGMLPKNTQGQALCKGRTVQHQPIEQTKIKINGHIQDKKTLDPIPFVNIQVIYEHKLFLGTQSDFDGNFSFTIDTAKTKPERIKIISSFVGCKNDTTEFVNASEKLLNNEVIINLEFGVVDITQIDIVSYTTTGLIDASSIKKKP